ncbi:hypothetical protein K488DRAFT_22697, partial [Vararia minispora EC-137]
GKHEPIQVVISGASDADILNNNLETGGLITYFESFGFARECLGQHLGVSQQANLGDGNGYVNESAVIRWDYGDAAIGTCRESVQGGNHFRYWIQDGSQMNTGAVFIAASYENSSARAHANIFTLYNFGRDWLIGNATSQSSLIPTLSLANGISYSGQTSFSGYIYQTNAQYVSGLLQNSSNGINHASDVAANGVSAVDGLVAVLNVRILQRP